MRRSATCVGMPTKGALYGAQKGKGSACALPVVACLQGKVLQNAASYAPKLCSCREGSTTQRRRQQMLPRALRCAKAETPNRCNYMAEQWQVQLRAQNVAPRATPRKPQARTNAPCAVRIWLVGVGAVEVGAVRVCAVRHPCGGKPSHQRPSSPAPQTCAVYRRGREWCR